jgi:hypothetical protein
MWRLGLWIIDLNVWEELADNIELNKKHNNLYREINDLLILDYFQDFGKIN